MGARVLHVDVTGRPIGFISWPRAIALLWQERAVALHEDENKILRSPSLEFNYPLIIQTADYVRLRPLRNNSIVKRVLYARDNYQCQYCGKEVTRSSGSIDHVKPRSKFIAEGRPAADANTWDNVVVSCVKCNTKKGDRLPMECGMMPMTTPKKPDYVAVHWAGKNYHPIQAEYVATYFKVDPETLVAKKL